MAQTTFAIVDPATGRELRTVPGHTDAQVQEILDRAGEAFASWRRTGFQERAVILDKAADLLEQRKRRLAHTMAEEMGKPVAQGEAEAEKCAWVCRYYAQHAASQLASRAVDTGSDYAGVAYQPLGVVLAIMPWNYPLWQVFRFAAPALMAGNVGVLKHASNVFDSAVLIEEILHDAGLPPACFRSLLIASDGVPAVLDHPAVRAATLTGSGAAGRAVAKACGERLLPTVLELGGSDAYVVLEDADVQHAAEQCVQSRLLNSGQSCIAAKRFVVVDAVYDAFVDAVVACMASKVMGLPTDADTDVGPQARIDLRDELHAQVERAVEQGARLALGGEVPDRAGAWYPPTVLVDVPQDSVAATEELFGPVAAILRATDEADAIRIANNSVFGLGAAVFTRDKERGRRIAEDELEAGCCFVNAYVKSDPRLPFGGIKESGYGRELAEFGIRAFCNAKAVWVA